MGLLQRGQGNGQQRHKGTAASRVANYRSREPDHQQTREAHEEYGKEETEAEEAGCMLTLSVLPSKRVC